MKPREQAQVGEERARIHHDLGGSLFGGSREFKFYFCAPYPFSYLPTFQLVHKKNRLGSSDRPSQIVLNILYLILLFEFSEGGSKCTMGLHFCSTTNSGTFENATNFFLPFSII